MPIYEYKCSACGAHIEKMQKVSDEPLTVCDQCGGRLEKQLSLSGFQFKGEGWYVTDYSKKSGSGAEAKSEKSEKSEKSSSADSTAKPDSASNKTKDTKTASKKD